MTRRAMHAVSISGVGATLLAAGLLAWSAAHVAGTIWHVAAPDTLLSAAGIRADDQLYAAQQRVSPAAVDLPGLQSVFVMRAPGQPGVADTAQAVQQAVDTRLALTLKGAVVSSDQSRSQAFIASAGTEQIYRQGDSLRDVPGNVVVQQIHATYVLIDNNGRSETLKMDEVIAASAAVADRATAQVPATASAIPGAETATMALPPGIAAGSALTDLVRLQPVFEPADSAMAGTLRGLQIRHGSRQDFLAAVGLQQGDLITGVDGKKLDASVDLSALLSQLSSQSVLALQVQRDQTLLTVTLDRSRW